MAMGNLVLLYENFADGGIFSGAFGSWTLPLANMQDPDIQRVARSSNATNAATKFRIDLGAPQNVDGLAFGPVNISPGASWRGRAYSDSSYSVLVYDTGTQEVGGEVIDWANSAAWLEWENLGFWLGISDPLDELPQFLFHVAPLAQTAQYWQIEVFDAANGDGFIEIGRLLIGKAFRPAKNYGEDNSLSIVPLTDVEESLGGLRVYWERGLRRSFACSFPSLTKSELFGDAFRVMLRSGISRQVFVVPDPDDTEFGIRRSFLATFKQMPAIRQLLVERGSTGVDLEEVL